MHPLDYACIVGFLAYASSTVVTPICLVLIVRELSLNLAEGGGLEAVRTGLILVVLLLGGILSGRWGKARMLGVSAFFMAGGLFLYALAVSYATLLLGIGLLGLGSGVLEGLINPLVQDQHPNDSGRYLNIINGFWSVGVLGTVLVAGELLTRDIPWRLIAAIVGLVSLGSGWLFLIFAKHEHTHRRQSFAVVARHIGKTLCSRRFWPFAGAMFFAGGVEGGFTFWSATLIQLWFGASPRGGGVGTALFAAGMVIGRFTAGHFGTQKGLRKMILASAVGGFAVSLSLFTVGSPTMLGLVLLLAGMCVACFWPSIQSLAADHVKSDHTMLFVLLSCAGIPGFGLTAWLMGIIAHHADVRAGFAVLPFAFLCLTATLAIASRPQAKSRC